MAVQDLPENLKLLCSYARSVSDVCRRTGLNRQQFNRYLNGQAKPSLRTLRRICDFFGFDDNELLLDHGQFREIVRLRPPRLEATFDGAHEFVEQLRPRIDGHIANPHKYLGYFHAYWRPSRYPGTIYRNLVWIHEKNGALLSKQVERLSGENIGLPRRMTYSGIVYGAGDRIMVTERETTIGHCMWHTALYATDYEQPTYLPGLMLGVMPDTAHQIIAYRVVWQFLGAAPDLRACLRACLRAGGRLSINDPSVNDYTRFCTDNAAQRDDGAFLPRF